jgi:phage FluMu protein Com
MQTYKHSGSTPFSAVALCLIAGLTAAAIGGFIYAWSLWYIPFIYLNFLATLLYAAIVGWVVGGAAAAGKIRNLTVVGLLSLACMLFGIWIYWGTSIWAMFGVRTGLIAWSPQTLFGFGQDLYEKGSWGFKEGDPIKGPVLALIWLVESGMLLGIAFKTAVGCVNQPFCESCQKWTTAEKGVARFDALGDEPVWQRVITDDLPALGEVPLLAEDRSKFVRLDFAKCPACENSNFMTLQTVEITTDNKGNVKVKERPLITHAVLTAEQSQIIRYLASMASEPQTTPESGGDEDATVPEDETPAENS